MPSWLSAPCTPSILPFPFPFPFRKQIHEVMNVRVRDFPGGFDVRADYVVLHCNTRALILRIIIDSFFDVVRLVLFF